MANVLKSMTTELISEFLTTKGREVIKRMFTEFESARLVRKFPGVHGKLKLVEQDVTKDLIYEYTSETDFSRSEDAVEVNGVTLETALMKVELKTEINADAERAYEVYLTGGDIKPDDLHLVEYLIGASVEKMQEELEYAMWQAVEDTNPLSAGTRKLIDRFNGYRKIAQDAAVAGKATVVATGAIDSTNAVTKLNQFFRAADKSMRKKGFHILVTYKVFEDYLTHYQTLHAGRELGLTDVKGVGYDFKGIPLTLGGGKTFIIPIAGLGDDDAIIGTRAEWLAYGFKYEGEMGEWDIQKHGWLHWMLNKFPIGVQILLKKAGFLLVNDQL